VNILIIGGLLGLAVLAILGAVLLGVGEDRAEKAQEKAQKELKEQQNSPAAPLPQLEQSRPTASQPAYQSVPATPLLSRPTVILPVSGMSETTGSLSLADLNGQVREITGELRALAQRAGDLQLRLNILSAALESQEASPSEPFIADPPADFFADEAERRVL
jgi:hypothetical protein